MSKLPYNFWCYHLTETGCTWRPVDYDARIVVKALKQEPFNGYLEAKIAGVRRRFDSDSAEKLIQLIMPLIGERLRKEIDGPISIVPVPNSGMAVGHEGPFRTVELAQLVAGGYGAEANVRRAVWWDEPRNKAHQSNDYRHPDLYEPHMVMGEAPTAPVVLFDDVLTSGSQMTAAARMLAKQGFPPARGLVVARATKLQHDDKFLSRREDQLELVSDPFDFDEI